MNIKNRIFDIIEKGNKDDKISIIFDYFIIFLIIFSVILIILESFQNLRLEYYTFFRISEIITVIIFTIEYLLRLWTSDLKIKHQSKIISFILFLFNPMTMIDLFAILPFYLPLIMPFDLRILRMLRITRMFRVLKFNRYSNSLSLLSKVLKREKENLLITLFLTMVLLVIASTMMYYIENEVQKEAFPNIIAALWWAVATLTTVGYGDIYPVTILGKFLAGVIALLGIGMVALPTGIISSGFMEEMSSRRKSVLEEEYNFCPHCGKKLNKKSLKIKLFR